MNDKRQLLCTFASSKSFKSTIEDIRRLYSVYSNRFFIFTNVNNPEEVFITYNIVSEGKEFPKMANTISIHRKKEFNVLYSLNSMNKIIQDENDGVFDKTFSVNWKLYSNSFIILNNGMIKIIPINLLEVIG
jgi:hypothetical protein